MTAIELVRFCGQFLKSLSECDIKTSDYKYVEMCDEYTRLTEIGHKKEYVIAVITERFHISESTLRRVLKRLYRPVKD